MELERLQKIIAHAGFASRREAETMIREGRVTVNGKVVTELGTKAAPGRDHIKVDGKPIKAVVQLTKQAFAFVFDRMTGRPVWPIEERPVPASDVPGERVARTQPFPTKPPPFDRQGVSESDVIDWTPELKAEALRIASREDDLYAARISMGQTREKIEDEAEDFFAKLVPGVSAQAVNNTDKFFAAGGQPSEAVNVFVDGASYKNDVLKGGVVGQDASKGNPLPQGAIDMHGERAKAMSIKLQLPKLTDLKPRINVIGVGGAGCNAINNMISAGLVGVAPLRFTGLGEYDPMTVWMPIASRPLVITGANSQIETFAAAARLAPGMTPQQATPAVDVIGKRVTAEIDRIRPSTEERRTGTDVVSIRATNEDPQLAEARQDEAAVALVPARLPSGPEMAAVPSQPASIWAILSAFGLLATDLRTDHVQTLVRRHDQLDRDRERLHAPAPAGRGAQGVVRARAGGGVRGPRAAPSGTRALYATGAHPDGGEGRESQSGGRRRRDDLRGLARTGLRAEQPLVLTRACGRSSARSGMPGRTSPSLPPTSAASRRSWKCRNRG